MIQNIFNFSMNKVYYINIDESEELGMFSVSLVDFPAVETQFLCFNEEKPKQLFFAKPEEHIITGVALRADLPIYRRRPDGSEYYVVFTKETIKKMIARYSKQGMMNNVDLQHSGELVSGVYMVESFIINDERGIRPKEFSDIEDGSWIVSYYVEDEALWNKIKNGNDLNGFSISCMANLIEKFEKQEPEEKDELDELIEELLK